jgi:hypothetical protein
MLAVRMDILFIVLLVGFFSLTWKLILVVSARDDG